MRRLFILAALGALLAVPGFSGDALPKHPRELKIQPLKFTKPNLEEIKLSCGLTGFLMENHEIPVVSIQLQLPTGFAPKDKAGLADLTAWALRNGGSVKISSDSLNSELEFRAAEIETWADQDWLSININCLTKDLDRTLELASDLLQHPAFPEAKIALKKKTMLEEVRRGNDDPHTVNRREFRKVLFGDHPTTWEPTQKSVQGLTREDVVAFYKTYGVPKGGLIGVSGDVKKAEVLAKLNGAFKSWTGGPAVIPPYPPMPDTVPASVNQIRKDINQAYIMIGHPGTTEQNPDRPALTLMNFILGGGSFRSWIVEKVRVEQGLAYSAGSRFGAAPRGVGAFTAICQTKAESMSRSINTILELIKKMQTEGPSSEELERARQALLNAYVFSYENPASIVNHALYLKFYGLPQDETERDLEVYNKLTLDDVKQAAKKYLRPEGMAMVVVGDPDKFDKPLSTWGKVNEIPLEQ
jgi:zinc protease